MVKAFSVAAVAAMLIPAGQAGAQDIEAGQSLYRDSCRQCHGPAAKGVGSFPKLLGYDAEHLAGRLTQYRAGERVGPNSALMEPVAEVLTDEEIANLAAFIAGLN